MNDVIQKELEKNYSKVVKKDLQVKEGIEKLTNAYEKTKKSNATNLKGELKEFTGTDKEINQAHKAELEKIKDYNKDQLAGVKVKETEVSKNHEEAEEKSVQKLEKEIARLEKAKEKLNSDFEKLTQKVLAQYNKDVEANQKEQDKISKDNVSEQEDLQEKYNDKEAKYNEKSAALNEKREAKITKLNEASTKKIEKLNDGIVKQREKVDKQLADAVPIFEEKLEEVNALLAQEQAEFESKLGDIKETLDSKLQRRNKFLEKAENENDSKAAKIQRKEIKQLEQSADREIKTLEKAHNDRKVDLEAKKLELLKNNLEQIAAVEREFVNFKEDNLMQVEINKVTLADEITKAKLDTELKLQDELAKFSEFAAKHKDQTAKALKESELALNEQKDLEMKLVIEFDKTNQQNEIQLNEDLSLNLKDQQIAELAKINECSVNDVDLAINLAKLENEREVQNFQTESDTLENDKLSAIKLHESDNKKLAGVKAEFLSNQEALVVLYQKRAEELLEAEELEINNRVNLKVKFLETQIKRVEQDLKTLVSDIELSNKQELNLYNKEIEKIASADQKEVTAFKQSEEDAIQALVDEKKELDPKADKARIMELDSIIESRKQNYRQELKQKEDFVFAKTQLFQENILLANQRKDKAVEEAKEMSTLETNDLNQALEVAQQNKEVELQEAKARYDKTVNNTNLFKNNSTNRNQSMTEENTMYFNNRVNKENKSIEDAKSLFEQRRNESNQVLDNKIQVQEQNRVNHNEELKNNAAQKEQELEAKLAEFKSQVAASNQDEQKRLQEQASKLSAANGESQNKHNQTVRETAATLRTQQAKYESSVANIDKKQDVETKNFEAEQTRVQKEYDIELKKGLQSIKTKLDSDIKAL